MSSVRLLTSTWVFSRCRALIAAHAHSFLSSLLILAQSEALRARLAFFATSPFDPPPFPSIFSRFCPVGARGAHHTISHQRSIFLSSLSSFSMLAMVELLELTVVSDSPPRSITLFSSLLSRCWSRDGSHLEIWVLGGKFGLRSFGCWLCVCFRICAIYVFWMQFVICISLALAVIEMSVDLYYWS